MKKKDMQQLIDKLTAENNALKKRLASFEIITYWATSTDPLAQYPHLQCVDSTVPDGVIQQ